MKIRIKKLHPEAVIPTYAKAGDAGMDLTAISGAMSETYIEYDTGIAVEIPEGHVGYVFPRSSISKKELVLANSVGVIDSNYRGPIKLRFKETGLGNNIYKPRERIGQLVIMPIPTIEFEEVEELTESARQDGAFGSTGK